jgi:hypothetical protein
VLEAADRIVGPAAMVADPLRNSRGGEIVLLGDALPPPETCLIHRRSSPGFHVGVRRSVVAQYRSAREEGMQLLTISLPSNPGPIAVSLCTRTGALLPALDLKMLRPLVAVTERTS